MLQQWKQNTTYYYTKYLVQSTQTTQSFLYIIITHVQFFLNLSGKPEIDAKELTKLKIIIR